MTAVRVNRLPALEAVRFFEAKGYAEVLRRFDWRDMMHGAHAAAFVVAKALRDDVLKDIRDAVALAIRDGRTLQEFAAGLVPLLQAKGWWGRAPVTDPLTGGSTIAQLGSMRRLRIIYDTNLRMAHAAGRWERIERLADRRPYLRYLAVLDTRTRPEHRAWNGITLPVSHSWWRTHYPPNGWRCRCTVVQLSERDMKARGWSVSDPPQVDDRPWRNGRTGQVIAVPRGIDPGFGYNVGLARDRALSPPPLALSLLPAVPLAVAGPSSRLPPLTPRPAPASRLLPPGRDADFYIDAFLAEFGATQHRPALFRDVVDELLWISRALFETPGGRLKVTKRGRETGLLLLADAIRTPEEVWVAWTRLRDGRLVLRRRYVRLVSIEGQAMPQLAVFEVGRDGWTGVTGFGPDDLDYLERQRTGHLAYRMRG